MSTLLRQAGFARQGERRGWFQCSCDDLIARCTFSFFFLPLGLPYSVPDVSWRKPVHSHGMCWWPCALRWVLMAIQLFGFEGSSKLGCRRGC